MKRAALLSLIAALALPAFATYTPYFTDQMNSYQSAYWTQVGTSLTYTYYAPGGYTQQTGGTANYISTVPVQGPDPNSYEVKSTIRLTSSIGGSFYLFLRATSNSSLVAPSGTNYCVQYTLGPTTGTAWLYKMVNGAPTLEGYTTISTHDGMTIRAMIHGNQIAAYVDDGLILSWVDYQPITSGMPGIGIGIGGGSTGWAMTNVQLGPLDAVAPGPGSFTTSVFSNHVDLQWPAISDDANGTGVFQYQILRNFQFLANTTSLTYSDTTVQAGVEYTYSLLTYDRHWNILTLSTTVTTPIAPSGSPNPPDGRQVGLRSTGTYWGALGEQIDLLSGNLNYSVPVFTAVGRNGWKVPFNLVYNSQNWRQDTGGTWNLGSDIGYGYGWRLMAGALLPVYSGFTLSYYKFTDASGAEYRLDVNNSGIWTSRESVYVEYDATANRLYFRDGKFWTMGCTSGYSPDAGTMYPTVMEDTNGNQINVTGFSGGASCGLISGIHDARSVSGSSPYTFSFAWNGQYHLASITSNVGTDEGFAFTYAVSTQQSPFSPYTTYPSVSRLTDIAHGASSQFRHYGLTYDSDNSGDLTQVNLPTGGGLAWTYRNVTYTGSITYRELATRSLSSDLVTWATYSLAHETTPANLHQFTTVSDPSGTSQKYWAFSLTGANTGIVTQFQGQQLPGPVTKTQNDLTWAQDSTGNLFIRSSLTTLDPGQSYQAQKKTDQNVDIHGNVTDVMQYAFNSLSNPARISHYTYVSYPAHTYNRLSQATVADGSTSTPVTLVTNSFDTTAITQYSGSIPQWDTAYLSATVRGNVTTSVSLAGYSTYTYDMLGNILTATVNGVQTAITPSSINNYAAPQQINTGTSSDTLTWNGFLGLTSDTRANTGDQSTITYDTFARPLTSTSPFGAVTSYTYATPPFSTSNPAWTQTTVNGRWTKTTVDGLGRTMKVESGDASGTKSQADTIYGTCCTAAGGVRLQTSLPHAPGAGAIYTTSSYDAIGRTLSVLSPDGASTTTYAYQGNSVTVTDPAGTWKSYTMDAFGHVTLVTEPEPSNPSTSTYLTNYTYDVLNHLTQVSMPRPTGTQTRKFNYTNPTTGLPGAFLMSTTNPESGTVNYTYWNGVLQSRTDAKGQQDQYAYDGGGRLYWVTRYYPSGGSLVSDPTQTVWYYYDVPAQNAMKRLSGVKYFGGNCTSLGPPRTGCDTFVETYTYNAGGAMVGKQVQVTRGSAQGSLNGTWTYDNEGRATGVTYPQWTNAGTSVPGSSYTYAFDTMGRLNTMTNALTSSSIISGTTYGVANEMLSLAGILNETRTYNSLFQLTRITVPSALDIQYAYSATQNNGKLTSQTDVISGEQVLYTYDALNRLATAQTAPNPSVTQWGQSYNYDGFGNLTDQNVILGSAPSMHVAYNVATNRQTGDTADLNGNLGANYVYDLENRLLQPGSAGSTTPQYAYDATGQRIWRGSTSPAIDEVTYWSGRQKLATYQISTSGAVVNFALTGTNAYLGGRLIGKGTVNLGGTNDKVTLASVDIDMRGSIGKFYPYGQEKPSATQNDTEKFTGYFRDAATGLDYANARYHQPGVGRFMTPDPYRKSAKRRNPGSWNRYAYVGGDPINSSDPTGLTCVYSGAWSWSDNHDGLGCSYTGTPVSDFGSVNPTGKTPSSDTKVSYSQCTEPCNDTPMDDNSQTVVHDLSYDLNHPIDTPSIGGFIFAPITEVKAPYGGIEIAQVKTIDSKTGTSDSVLGVASIDTKIPGVPAAGLGVEVDQNGNTDTLVFVGEKVGPAEVGSVTSTDSGTVGLFVDIGGFGAGLYLNFPVGGGRGGGEEVTAAGDDNN